MTCLSTSLCVLPSVSCAAQPHHAEAVSCTASAYLSIIGLGRCKRQLTQKRIFPAPWRSCSPCSVHIQTGYHRFSRGNRKKSFINSPTTSRMGMTNVIAQHDRLWCKMDRRTHHIDVLRAQAHLPLSDFIISQLMLNVNLSGRKGKNAGTGGCAKKTQEGIPNDASCVSYSV